MNWIKKAKQKWEREFIELPLEEVKKGFEKAFNDALSYADGEDHGVVTMFAREQGPPIVYFCFSKMPDGTINVEEVVEGSLIKHEFTNLETFFKNSELDTLMEGESEEGGYKYRHPVGERYTNEDYKELKKDNVRY